MKRPISGLVALLAGAFAGYSQGTLSEGTVFFANYAALQTYVYVSLGTLRLSPPYNPTVLLGGPSTVTTGNPIQDTGNGSDWTIALYGYAGWNDSANTLVPLNDLSGNPVTATLEKDDNYDQTPGTWVSPAIAGIPGTALSGQDATVQLYAWYNDGGRVTSYAAAIADGLPTGFSATANIITGGPQLAAPPTIPANLPDFGTGGGGVIEIMSGQVVPEPTTVALGLIGSIPFLMRLNKKP